MLERFDQRLRVQAYSIMTSTYQRRDEKVEVLFTNRFLREFSGNQRRAFYQIWKNDAELVKRSASLGESDLPIQYGKERQPKYWDLELPNGLKGRAIGIRYEPRVRGSRETDYNEGFKVTLVVATDVNEIETTLAGLRNLLLFGGIATLVVSPVFVLIVLGSGLSPLKELAGRMGKVDADSLETHFDEGKLPIELRPIAGQLNNLFNRLQKSFERERQFSADVSHELRTPIATLLNIAEVGLKWKEGESKKDYEAMRAISLEMQQTVNQLLDLSRADSGHIDLHLEPLAIEEVVSSIWSRHKDEGSRRKLTTKLSGLDDVVWVVDRTLFEHIVDNLINNAVSYAPEGGEIQIEVLDGGSRLVFRNVSIELEQLDMEKLFDRFWRKDSARSMDEHRGLGLAVVAVFAEKMQLQLEPRLTDEGVFEIAVIYSTKEI